MTTTVYLLDGFGSRVPVEYLGPHRSLADRGRAMKPCRANRDAPQGFSRVRDELGDEFPVRNDYLIVPCRDDPRGSPSDGRELQGKRSPSGWGGAATPRSPG
ncbi:hypothetical protein [Brevibacterium gallinarum]|uniref:Uncharacterized protein n=1 Tax=Brevibacterium gallinarum TaxID=2762220 RepID=A0ABR8WQJ8_9MICO|nr:hypothetical protein [Brevibacterium gallinarum]MBD8019352.1 hypothetical protein [Brevibacterium gallinarum]